MQQVAAGVSARFALALTLAWETGRRIGSIRHLCWADVDLENATLLFRKEFDKGWRKGARDSVVPISEAAVAALVAARRERVCDAQQIGDGWLFTSSRSTSKPLGRRYFLRWWHKAEERAELPPVPGRGWHSCRRAFATEMLGSRRVADELVNSLGGWARGSTVARTIYQQPLLEQQRAAIRTRAS
jgi:integrase